MTQLVPTPVENRARQADIAADEAREELAKKNAHFVQWQESSISEVRRLARCHPAALQVLLVLVEKMNKQNAIMISKQTLAEILGFSRATLTRSISTLRNENWIQIVKIGAANAYVLNNRVFWRAAGNLKHTSFSATIVASESEQAPADMKDVRLKKLPPLAHLVPSSQTH